MSKTGVAIPNLKPLHHCQTNRLLRRGWVLDSGHRPGRTFHRCSEEAWRRPPDKGGPGHKGRRKLWGASASARKYKILSQVCSWMWVSRIPKSNPALESSRKKVYRSPLEIRVGWIPNIPRHREEQFSTSSEFKATCH